MKWINVDEAAFYGLSWALGFLAATFVILGDRNRKPIGQCFITGAIGGFLSFSAVSLLVGRIDGPVVGHWYYLGVSALIGLSARQGEQIRAKFLEIVLNQRIVFMDKDKDKRKDDDNA